MVGVGLVAAGVFVAAKYIQSEHCDRIMDLITTNAKILAGKFQ